jgi:tetratricopeptide (TPR) repeat protein
MKPAALLPVALAIVGALGTVGDAGALTLGRAQGVPLIGRSLEVSVPVTLDGPADTMPECVEADVFYGDTRLGRERVTTEVGPAPSGASIRVRSRLAVNEPVVTVYLQLGCTNRLTRRLVLFAEQPDPEADRFAEARASGQALPSVTPGAVPAASAAVPAPGRAAGGAAASRAARTASARPATPAPTTQGAQPRTPAAAAPAAAASRSTSQRAARQAQGRQARLKLEPLDLSVAVDPQLRMTEGMAAPGPVNTDQRALAIALWKALNAQPEDLLRDAQRLQAMENDLRSMRQSIQRNEAALLEVRGQLQQARDDRYANPLVYLLAALALLAALVAIWFWRRSNAPERRWWSGPDGDADVLDRDGVVLRPDPRDRWDFPPASTDAKAAARRGHSAPVSSAPASEVPSSSGSRDSSAGKAGKASRPSREPSRAPAAAPSQPSFPSSNTEFPASQLGPRALKAEELHDVQQEADFFVSLGEYDRAIELLRSHINANPQTSAIAWLDLIDIYHLLGRRMEFDEVRREFQSLFNAKVPEYDNYAEAMPGLEDYPGAMERICILWPHPRVLEVIEESIFRGPATDGTQAFSLEAYRDLLMLHHIGTEALVDGQQDDPVRMPSFTGGGADDTGDDDDGEAAPGFAATSISPLLAAAMSQPTIAVKRRDFPPELLTEMPTEPLPEIGLDINLAELDSDEPLIGASGSQATQPRGAAAARDDGHLLDFDLPDIDMSPMATRKTRE